MNTQLEGLSALLSGLDRVAPAITADPALLALSSAHDGEVAVDLAQPLFPFQRAGVAYAIKQRRVIIGDEMGLGKTPQGIAVAVQAVNEKHKVLVVVPPSLRTNWVRSFKMFAPWLSVAVVKGSRVGAIPKADVVIIGDSNVDLWSLKLAGKFGALIVDEAHRAKNAKSGRTKGIAYIAKSIPTEGYVVLLSGTIIVARDMAHAKKKEYLEEHGDLPDYFKQFPIYYAGPAKTPAGMASGSFGPTTAGRMDSYVDLFQSHGGSMVMLAKGNRSQAVTDACHQHGGFYLGSAGGPAALLAQDHIRSQEIVDYPELGMEAVWKITVENFPAFILVDNKGNDFFQKINQCPVGH